MNRLREKLNQGEAARGVWTMLPSVESARLIAQLPVDWMLIDSEHAPIDDLTLAHIVSSVVDANGPAAIVRVVENSVAAIKRALDVGAWGVLVPMVNTPEEAKQAVMAAKFPPPPIQLPERAARIFQESSGSQALKIRKATGPPIMIPSVPVSIIRMALRPTPRIAGISVVTIRMKRLKGSSQSLIQS